MTTTNQQETILLILERLIQNSGETVPPENSPTNYDDRCLQLLQLLAVVLQSGGGGLTLTEAQIRAAIDSATTLDGIEALLTQIRDTGAIAPLDSALQLILSRMFSTEQITDLLGHLSLLDSILNLTVDQLAAISNLSLIQSNAGLELSAIANYLQNQLPSQLTAISAAAAAGSGGGGWEVYPLQVATPATLAEMLVTVGPQDIRVIAPPNYEMLIEFLEFTHVTPIPDSYVGLYRFVAAPTRSVICITSNYSGTANHIFQLSSVQPVVSALPGFVVLPIQPILIGDSTTNTLQLRPLYGPTANLTNQANHSIQVSRAHYRIRPRLAQAAIDASTLY